MRLFSRLPPKPERATVSPEELEDFDFVETRTAALDYHRYRQPAQYFEALLNAPELAAAIVRLGQVVRRGQLRGSYTDADRELVDIVLGTDLGCNAIFTVHLPDAVAVGVRPEAIQAICRRREENLSERERHIAQYAREVVDGRVTDVSYARMVDRLGAQGALEFTGFIGTLLMVIRLWQALGVPEPSDEEIDALIAGLLDGSIALPDPAARIG